jgi:nucleotide-binding universal stress UspA family protein
MGSYGYNPVLEVVLGSAVDQVLRSSQHPTLICR